MKDYDVIVVGGGAAGLLAAGKAASGGAKVLILEKMERPGRKLLITGKGRCNITNRAPLSEFLKHIYPNGRYLRHAFSEFFNENIITLLEKNGLETITERGERVFPKSEKAVDVVNTLISWVKHHHVDFVFHARVKKILVENNQVRGVLVHVDGREKEMYSGKVIIATGGKSYPATGSTGEGYSLASDLGHQVTDVYPGLVPLNTVGDVAGKLQGLSLKNVSAVVWVEGKKKADDFGEMLFTHFGLTGPIILTLSRDVVFALRKSQQVEISIDLKPALDVPKLDKRLLRDIDAHGKKKLENLFKLWLPLKMVEVFISELKLDPDKSGHQVTADERKRIRNLMKNFRFTITGYRSFKEAIITTGGVSTSEISSKTMESKIIRNLYFAGEVLDLDADTGGYNLQIAFSTGWLAGKSCSD